MATAGLCYAFVRFCTQAARLWIHEVERVFRDRMVSDTDMAKFEEFKIGVTKKYFEDLGMPALEQAPLLFTSFMQVGFDPPRQTG